MLKDMDFCHSGEICLTNTENNYWMLLQYKTSIIKWNAIKNLNFKQLNCIKFCDKK